MKSTADKREPVGPAHLFLFFFFFSIFVWMEKTFWRSDAKNKNTADPRHPGECESV